MIFSPFYIEYIIYILMASRGRLDVALYINDQFAENSLSNALQYLRVCYFKLKFLTLTRQIGLPPHTPDAQKIADQRLLHANSARNRYFLYKMMWLKAG